MANMKHEILLGLTTTPGSDWRGKVEEMKKFGIKRIALFPTFLEIDKRKELCGHLESINGLKIPHVHLRSDMDANEVSYFIKKFETKVFNIHAPQGAYKFEHDYTNFLDKIFIENTHDIPTVGELNMFAGLCIDFSHLEDRELSNVELDRIEVKHMIDLATRFPIGCSHVSAVYETVQRSPDPLFPDVCEHSNHLLEHLSQLDYMKKYKQYLPQYISLELENSFEQQLKAKKYLEEILNI